MRKRRFGFVALIAALAGGCATIQGIRQDSIDLLQVATSSFVPPAYGNLVGKFVDTLKKQPMMQDPVPTSGATTSDPAAAQTPTASIPVATPTSGATPILPSMPSAPAAPAEANVPLQVEFDVVKQVIIEGTSVAVPVRDGDVLHDGGSNAEGGDNYRILFRANGPCHIYVVQVDASAKIDTLFPGGVTGGVNPVRPNQEYSLPTGGDWLYLDTNKGIETIYFFASRQPKTDFEQLLAQIEKEKPKEPIPVRIEAPIVATRGVGGKRPGRDRKVEVAGGKTSSVSPTAFLAEAKTTEVVLTRWFRHE